MESHSEQISSERPNWKEFWAARQKISQETRQNNWKIIDQRGWKEKKSSKIEKKTRPRPWQKEEKNSIQIGRQRAFNHQLKQPGLPSLCSTDPYVHHITWSIMRLLHPQLHIISNLSSTRIPTNQENLVPPKKFAQIQSNHGFFARIPAIC